MRKDTVKRPELEVALAELTKLLEVMVDSMSLVCEPEVRRKLMCINELLLKAV
jgi:hypothetical protein